MSRNLCQTHCDFCGCCPLSLDEAPRPITKDDAGPYFDEFRGMMVADATCPACLARYLAWIDGTNRSRYRGYPEPCAEYPIQDLSFRSTFNDEAGIDDEPRFAVQSQVVYARIGPWSGSRTPALPMKIVAP